MPTAIVLGTAQDGGNPQLGSVGRGPARLVASLGIIGDGGQVFLIDVTPDVRVQVAALVLHSGYRSSGDNAVDHVALTHAHMGHYAGLVHFGKEAHNTSGVHCWMTPSMSAYLVANQPWRALFDNGNLVAEVGEPFEPFEGLVVRMVHVPHRADFTDTVGYSLNDELLYLPDIDSWDEWPEAEAEISRHRVVLVDATFFSEDELPGRDIREIPHPLVTDTMDRFRHLDTRIILTHLNHSNPISDAGSPESALVTAAGMEIAYDGMEITLGQ